MRRLGAAVLALVLAAAACGVPTDSEPRPIPDDRVPFDLLSPDAGPPPSTP
jgi:hypothetical protein